MKRATASYIWNCIQDHSGDFSEDRGEWLYGMDINEKDLEDFITMINDAISQREAD